MLHSLRSALRSLLKSPGFSAVALVTLALGIGANTALFSVVSGVLLRPLDFSQPERIDVVWRTTPDDPRSPHAPADFLDLAAERGIFAAAAGFVGQPNDVTPPHGEPQRLEAVEVTAGFFDVFGVPATLGRTLQPANDPRFQLSPKGERALIVARGDVFTAPIEKGPTRNLTRTSNAHDKHARWSPDGRRIAFISDRSGEEQVWVVDQDGTGQPEQLTDRFKAMLYAPEWSGDGKRLAFSDKDGKVYVLTVADRKVVEIADDAYGRIFDYDWSADGGHLAFSQQEANGQRALWIWSVGDGKARRVTDGFFNAESPAWDPARVAISTTCRSATSRR